MRSVLLAATLALFTFQLNAYKVKTSGTADNVSKMFATPGKSSERECTKIDLLATSAPLNHWSQSRIQKPLDWCPAMSLADVLTYKTRRPISGMQIAALFHSAETVQEPKTESDGPESIFDEVDRDSNLGYGGLVCELFESAKKNGLCHFEDVEGAGVSGDMLSQLATANKILAKGGRHAAARLMEKNCFSASKLSPYFQILRNFDAVAETENARIFMGQFVQKVCKGKTFPVNPNLNCHYYYRETDSSVSGSIDQFLEQGAMPILALEQVPLYSFIPGPQKSPHSVTVNARRWNKLRGRCEYRIRNSQKLLNCSYYGLEVSCSAKEFPTGHVWVSGEFIDRTGDYLTVIHDSPPK